MKIIKIPEADSTNSWMLKNRDGLEIPVMVYAERQFSGRGQRGNSWESEAGKNLTASFLLRPENILAKQQFHISEMVALSVVELLREFGILAEVKWPNDIYVGDRKISGILIENSIMGQNIEYSVAGIGLNVNQEVFRSEAPNPVSMTQIVGRIFDIDEIAPRLADILEKNFDRIKEPASLHNFFLDSLWRGDRGFYRFHDRIKEEEIVARIADIAPDGLLTLETKEGENRSYRFKEVEFII